MGILVVVIDEIPLCILISLSDDWSHVYDLVNVKSAHKQIVKIINGCGRWRSVNPSCESESILVAMSVNSNPFRITVIVSAIFVMIALDL